MRHVDFLVAEYALYCSAAPYHGRKKKTLASSTRQPASGQLFQRECNVVHTSRLVGARGDKESLGVKTHQRLLLRPVDEFPRLVVEHGLLPEDREALPGGDGPVSKVETGCADSTRDGDGDIIPAYLSEGRLQTRLSS